MQQKRILALDGLRGLAITLVLVLHSQAGFADVPPGSVLARVFAVTRMWWCGVDLFFILSGFLIGGILLDARSSPGYYRAFYTRRAYRILPLYLLLLGWYAAASHWLPPFGEKIPFWTYGLMLQNFSMARTGSFGVVWLSVTWSLAIEEQFYLVAPMLIRRCRKIAMRRVVIATILAAPVVRVALVLAYPKGFVAAYVLVFARSDALMLGVGIAMLVRSESAMDLLRERTSWLRVAGLILGVAIAFLTRMNLDIRTVIINAVGYSIVDIFFAVLVILVLTNDSGSLARAFRIRPLRFLGVRAYAVYLFHAPLIYFAFMIAGYRSPRVSTASEWLISWIGIAVAFALATLSWRYVELPLLARGRRSQYGRPAELPGERLAA